MRITGVKLVRYVERTGVVKWRAWFTGTHPHDDVEGFDRPEYALEALLEKAPYSDLPELIPHQRRSLP